VLSPFANVLSPIAWLANKLYAIEEKSKEVVLVFVYCLAQRRCQRCKLVFSATITLPDQYENQSVVFCTQNCIKACKNALNTAITVKLLKSKVIFIFNTCEKLKIDTRHTGKSQRSMRLVIVKHVTIKLKCGSGWSGSTERICG
jgi:hypothetical protein